MMDDAQHELRRSHKVDFAGNSSGITRERSFIRPNSQHHHQGQQNHKRRSQILAQPKGKPTLEIYRPPNSGTDSRSDGLPDMVNPKLNVHAKEFTMRQHLSDLQTSRSSANLPREATLLGLQHSRSSGNILRHPLQNLPIHPPHLVQQPQQQLHPSHHHNILPIPLLQSASSGNILHHSSPRVHFQLHAPAIFTNLSPNTTPNYNKQQHNKAGHQNLTHLNYSQSLKRSKSMSAADSQSLAAKLKDLALQADAPDLGEFVPEVQNNMQIACEDPNKLPGRALMELAKHIMERVVEGRKYSLPGAKICSTIIEKEQTETFLESLINICQQWYQERDRILRNVKAADGSKFTAFMWFLTEMSCQLKRMRLQKLDRPEKDPPSLVLLALLVRCCQACVRPPIRSLAEIECLFFVLTSIGRDLEQELPSQLDHLLTSVRDGFLASAALPAIRKTLLQLIELKASNWQLSGPTVLYYYPKMK